MKKKNLNALYYIRKNQILASYKSNPNLSDISDSFAYAISHDCYPIFQSSEETEIYKDFFFIKHDDIKKVVIFLDENWIHKKYYTFYELEDIFVNNDLDNLTRDDLIVIIRYCYLDKRFTDSKFWEKLEEACPVEAKYLSEPFQISDLTIL